MKASRLACAAGAAAVVLVTGCEEPAASTAPATSRPSPVDTGTVPDEADADRRTLAVAGGGAERVAHGSGLAAGVEGLGFRPTGSTANGITP
jgi:hypothetical protein